MMKQSLILVVYSFLLGNRLTNVEKKITKWNVEKTSICAVKINTGRKPCGFIEIDAGRKAYN